MNNTGYLEKKGREKTKREREREGGRIKAYLDLNFIYM
jgi:hypothetical protein